jgi:hypothetical protein
MSRWPDGGCHLSAAGATAYPATDAVNIVGGAVDCPGGGDGLGSLASPQTPSAAPAPSTPASVAGLKPMRTDRTVFRCEW